MWFVSGGCRDAMLASFEEVLEIVDQVLKIILS